MPTISTLLMFVTATLALLVVPGPAVVYIVTRTVAQGRTAGLVSVLGIHVGSIFYVVLTSLGLSALLLASTTAFQIVKWLGVAYLVWLGVQKLWLTRTDDGSVAEPPRMSNWRIFTQGVLVNILNPKTLVFFVAFLPQFVDPARGSVGWQLLFFGIGFIVLGILSDGTYALLASALSGRLRRTATARRRLDLSSGLVYIALGAVAATISQA
ncbi:LysE family translocator [Actinophytocola xanthii]|uniref:RhtB family transporter n=1 Tax=Actinophytocola xanthii TaxID=1912961 RepID=A0A1Q8CXX7_9PSEU|nr:LysE family translocator [Actinophytocola xanthii]OLF19216.1 RhtB family transporter [Actinophytocola xanthii]